MNSHQAPARLRLDAALLGLAVTFRGMTVRPDEHNCECHWGSAEELAQLKTPDLELGADLLRRTWRATWGDGAAVLRRILPQFAKALTNGAVEPFDMWLLGRVFLAGGWQQWPAEQVATVQEFLDAWWLHTLSAPAPVVPAHHVLAQIAEASATLSSWLHTWDALTDSVASSHLAEAATQWEYGLLGDQLPWDTWQDETHAEAMRVELTIWLVGNASRIRRHGAPEELLHRIRLLGLSGAARWEDPHWPTTGTDDPAPRGMARAPKEGSQPNTPCRTRHRCAEPGHMTGATETKTETET